ATFRREAPQERLEDLGGLAALDQIPLVDDDRWHRIDAARAIELLARAHFGRVFIRTQDLARAVRVESDMARKVEQHIGVARIAAVGEVGGEQRVLERTLLAFRAGP